MRTYSSTHMDDNGRLRRSLSWIGRGLCLLGYSALVLQAGCLEPPPPYVPLHAKPPQQAYCFDGAPHLRGEKPWILGGRCCCTPTEELMAKLHADGICLEMDVDDLIDLYHKHGVQLAYDHERCNNLCELGPHVTKGGRCMVPPTPGTRNYEEVVTGTFCKPVMPREPKEQGGAVASAEMEEAHK